MRKLLTFILLSCVATGIAFALPTAIKNRAFFEGITYQWPYNAAPADQQTSNLGEIATDPDQIIAMLREVYSNPAIPGNYTRGYSAEGVTEGTWTNGTATGNYPVAYPAVGTIGRDANGDIDYLNSYGWDLAALVYRKSESGTVSFTRNQDRTRASNVKKNGITLNMYQLYGNSGTTSSPTYYFNGGTSNDIILEAEDDKLITNIKLTFVSGYSAITSTSATGGSGSYSSGTWTGSAKKVTFKHSSAVRLTQVDVTYESVGPIITPFMGTSETVTYVPGTDLGNNVVSSSSSGQKATKGGFIVDYISGGFGSTSSTWYQAAYGYDARFKTYDGYTITNMNFTFLSSYGTGVNNDGSRLQYIKYWKDDGTEVTITSTSSPSFADLIESSNLSFSDNGLSMSWNIPTKTLYIKPNGQNNLRFTYIEATYKYDGPNINYFAHDSYTPNEEGNTVLLLEVKDGMTINGLITAGLATKNSSNTFDYYNISDYATLRAVVAATIKSARVLTDAKRVGSGINAGTLFKIDADKLNRFYLLGKGQLRWFNNDYNDNGVNATTPPRTTCVDANNQPYFIGGNFYDQSVEALLSHMFEQFSPSQATGGTALNDVYRLLVNGDSFNVVHDCLDVISAEGAGHEFNMYGKESLSEDCQDVRDMMFFVPDYRMLAHEGNATVSKRDPNKAQKFLYYNPDHAPTMGLYVIKLDEITDAKRVKVEGEDAYDIDLTWTSNLLDFLPGEQGVYKLYRVSNVNGVETYTQVLDGNGQPVTITTDNAADLHYTDRVAQLPNEGQTITYAVRGQDSSEFLSLQMSNKESVYIPGIDVSEDLNLKLKADYYSRFDPQTVCNNYSNLVTMGSTVSNISAADLEAGTLTFTRSYTDGDGEHSDVIATGTASNGTMTIAMQNQSFFKYGYNSNGTASEAAPNPSFTKAYTVNGDGVQFTGDFKFYDNFTVSVADNTHPSEYVYQVEFTYGDKYAKSNTMSVYVHKTNMDMDPTGEGARAVTLAQINSSEEKTSRALPANAPVNFDIDVKYSSKKEILRYDAYRWNEGENRYIIEPSSPANNEQDVAPNGIAGNQGDYYTVAMNSDTFLTTGSVAFEGDATTAQARFTDAYVAENAGVYTYVPVVETFAPNEDRTDYNTYGAPLQTAATADVEVTECSSYAMPGNSVSQFPQKSDYTWMGDPNDHGAKVETGGKTYAYYTALLNLEAEGQNGDVLVPQGYELYMVRVWRQIAEEYLGEELSSRRSRMGDDVLMEELTFPDITVSGASSKPLGSTPSPLATGSNPNELVATFGALDVVANEIDIPVKFIVRAYYTLASNLAGLDTPTTAPRRIGGQVPDDAKFYVVEKEFETTLQGTGDNQIVTAINAVVADTRQVQSVTYYNMAGNASTRPFEGMNVKVTRYTDGTTHTIKVVK